MSKRINKHKFKAYLKEEGRSVRFLRSLAVNTLVGLADEQAIEWATRILEVIVGY